MNRRICAAGALLVALILGTARTAGASGDPAPAIGTLGDVTTVAIATGPGDQTDPHVAGRYVAYTSEVSGNSEVRFYNLATGVDGAVDNYGGLDFLPDTDGTTITYTHLAADAAIRSYNPATGVGLEDAPTDAANRRESRIAGSTLVWQDFGYTDDVTKPELVIEDTATGALTRLTNDDLLDKDPAVSPDGNTIVWTKCQTDGKGCVIWEARQGPGGWSSSALTGPDEGEAGLPDTDGTYVVYSVVAPSGDEDIRWLPVGGGVEHDVALPGQQTNPNISNGVVTFEQLDRTTQVPSYDVWLYDIEPNTLYRLTSTPEDETLNDVSVSLERQVTVVWTKSETNDNVYAEWFALPPLATQDTTPPTVAVEGFTDGQQLVVGAPRPDATCSSNDDGSGIATTTGPVEKDDLTANGVGSVSVNCTATDRAGNSASATSTYRIDYAFGGFLAPVGATTNGHAGRTVPVKWHLSDANGAFVDELSAVDSVGYRSCDSATIEPATGALRYDPDAHQYVFTWKTPRAAGCYVLSVTLDSGQNLEANFRLT